MKSWMDEPDLATVIGAELEVQRECMGHPDHAAALARFASGRS